MRTQTDKDRLWKEMSDRMSTVTDKLGKGIDAGIMDLVVVLNLLEFPTAMSCEGHLEWGTYAPWVDIEDQSEAIRQKSREMTDLFKVARDAYQHGEPSSTLFDQAHQARREAIFPQLQLQQRLLNYLSSFYMDRSVPVDRHLVIQTFGIGRIRLQSQGAPLQEIAPAERRAQKLVEYQQEMQAFTDFLKKQFFCR